VNDLGVVVVGRNEGERLRRCLASVLGRGHRVVYVDSASIDGSVGLARSMGAEVVELDQSLPFSVARARNEGFERLLQLEPTTRFVQFVDGDCEVVEGWVDCARRELEANQDLAIVCGRRRERFPERSIYNRLADMDWDAPIGGVPSCGGDALVRAEALRQVGGFNSAVIVGEEVELCLRLRRRGWRIVRVDTEMTIHDMAMMRFSQWWRRSVRTGHGYAQGAALHGRSPERHWVREMCSSAFWGALVPVASAGLAWPTRGISLVLWAGYPLLLFRIARRSRRQGMSVADAWLYAGFCVVGKIPESIGLLRYFVEQCRGVHASLIYYKENVPTRSMTDPNEPTSAAVRGRLDG
jgi:GT2 family glycosyltransferase